MAYLKSTSISLLTNNTYYQFSIPQAPAQKSLFSIGKTTFEHVENISNHLQDERPESRLLTLPLEIRLQIYAYLMYPASNRHLAPNPTANGSPPEMNIPSYLINHRGCRIPTSFYHSNPTRKHLTIPNQPNHNSLSKSNPQNHLPNIHKLPISLLLTTKQIYLESRHLPFENNNWIFANWYNSGLCAANTFSRKVGEWQRGCMRWVGLEVVGAELVGRKGGCVDEWVALCGVWEGVWGVRVCVMGRVGGYGCLVDGGGNEEGGSENGGDESEQDVYTYTGKPLRIGKPARDRRKMIFMEKSVMDVEADWVTKGLTRLKSLRYLEVIIAGPDCSTADKVQFQLELGMFLHGPEVRVRGLGEVGDA